MRACGPLDQRREHNSSAMLPSCVATWATQAKAWTPVILRNRRGPGGGQDPEEHLRPLPLTSSSPLGGCQETVSHYLPGSDEDEAFWPTALRGTQPESRLDSSATGYPTIHTAITWPLPFQGHTFSVGGDKDHASWHLRLRFLLFLCKLYIVCI